jgi:hypothetical protein
MLEDVTLLTGLLRVSRIEFKLCTHWLEEVSKELRLHMYSVLL